MKIAVIGLGSIGRRHVANFSSLGCTVSTFDPQYGGTLSEALDGAAGAVIATPPDSHLELAWWALDAGCHLMIEKPIALTDAGVDDLLRIAVRRQKTVMVAYPWRYDAGMRELRGRVWGPGHISTWYGYDTGNATARNMGPFLDCSHALDFLRWIQGEVWSVEATQQHEHADLHLTFASGNRGFAHLSLDEPLQRTWTFTGTHSVTWTRNDLDVNAMYVEEARHFLDCINGRDAPMTNGWDGLRTLEVALASKLAAQTGQRVDL